MKKYLFSAFVLLFLSVPTTSFAWSKKGHALVAAVAFNYMDPTTRKVLLEYLDGMTIEDAANWMDDIKSDKSYDYLKKQHYINAERGQKIGADGGENIIGLLTKTIEELKDYKSLSKQEVKMKLCILFHLIGDLHQRLHVGYGDDKGGNDYQVNFYGRGTNLHAFYDSGIIEYKNLTLSQCMKAKIYTKEELAQIGTIDVVAWANQSRSFLPVIYKTNGAKLTDSYVDSNTIIIQEQIQKAGIRLAGVLKVVFV